MLASRFMNFEYDNEIKYIFYNTFIVPGLTRDKSVLAHASQNIKTWVP